MIDADQVIRLHRTGLTQAEIARELGVSRGAIRRRLQEAGILTFSMRRPAWLDQG